MKLLRVSAFVVASLLGGTVWAQNWQFDGNLKYRLLNTHYPTSSVFHDLLGSDATDHSLSARLNTNFNTQQWSATASYQLTGLYADSLEISRSSADGPLFRPSIQNDDTRLFDLTHTSNNGDGKQALVGRFDRLEMVYKNDRNVIKIGRQAVSWGNGLIYTPMDFFNPFDPTAIDTEYKTGDDMLYAQHLFKGGNDLQLVWVLRRDEDQQTSSEVNSVAVKLHGFVGSGEFDLILAEHYSESIAGLGGAISIGGSVVRGDWVVTDTGDQYFNNAVVNISYSWTVWDKNVTASLEYFHNDFGARKRELSLFELNTKQDLLSRVERGELFTLGRDYLAGSTLVELAPLWLLTSNVFYNITDESALVQVVTQHDLTQNTQLVIALSAPLGPQGTEFGGILIDSRESEKFSNNDWSLYAQLAWYF